MVTLTRHEELPRLDLPAGHTTSESGGARARVAPLALGGLRVALGFEFLWAFIDKLFGLSYSTPSSRAWIHGGSPTKGFLAGVSSGPLKGFYHSLSGTTGVDWLFMAALLGIGTALILGVALRPTAVAGGLLLIMMWFASWPPASTAGGQPSGSVNPVVDDHIISTFALIVIAVFAASGAGYLGRRWSRLPLVAGRPWLR